MNNQIISIGYGTTNTLPSLCTQWLEITKWAHVSGMSFVNLYADIHVNPNKSHPELQKAVTECTENKAVFVVNSLRNLTTSHIKFMRIIKTICESDSSFFSIQEGLEISDNQKHNILPFIRALCDIEDALNKKRSSFLRKEKNQYLKSNIRHNVINDPKNVIGTIIRLRREKHPYRYISKVLSRLGTESPRKKKWHPKVVMEIYKSWEDKELIFKGQMLADRKSVLNKQKIRTQIITEAFNDMVKLLEKNGIQIKQFVNLKS